MWTPLPGTQLPGAKNEALNASSLASGPAASANLELDDSAQRTRLNQVFNTALVSSRAENRPDSASEIQQLMDLPAFGAILQSVQLLAGEQGISEVEAAREIITTFRKMDRLWTDYLVSEGVERLKLSN